MSGAEPRKAVLITGHGRSGTNWLVDLLDLSRMTHSRSEPNEIPSSALAQFAVPEARMSGRPDMAAGWEAAVAQGATEMGERDRPVLARKEHHNRLARSLGLLRLIQNRKTRRLLGLVSPALRRPEWRMPRWMGSRARLLEAAPVFKMVMVPGWVEWVLRSRSEFQVLHLIRHPGGFLNSWRRRYLAHHGERDVLAANLERIRTVAALDPEVVVPEAQIQTMGLSESELWFWRYANEVVFRAGQETRSYREITYERLALAPLAETKAIYEFCDLAWTEEIEVRVQSMSARSAGISRAWRAQLTSADVDVVESVLEGSVLGGLWSES